MRILTIIATAALLATSVAAPGQADDHSGNKCVPFGCYER